MIDFSADGNLGFISLVGLARALNGSSRQIQLPAFQRDAVWDEAHTELLWDSLYRGYPIGSLIFADVSRLQGNNHSPLEVRDTQVSRQQAAHGLHDDLGETQYIIIDGQQRAIAVALGFRQLEPEDSARLWVDLGEDAETLFAVCTIQKPWGLNARSSQITQAKKRLDQQLLTPRGDFLYELSPLQYTWPLRCNLPVPLAELMVWLENGQKGNWRELVPEADRANKARTDMEALFQRLRELRQTQLPVYLVREMTTTQLGEIFQRLNKQGVPMTDQELFFSALKMKWPKAHDLVWAIYADEETGRFMRPREIVRLAVRLVFGTERHIARLNLDEFERLTIENPERFAALQHLLEKEPGEKYGRLHTLLRQARAILSYDPVRGDDDPGLPAVLLALLPPRVWHTLVAWLAQHDGESVSGSNREEMIRYALLDYYFSGNATQRLDRIPFEKAFQEAGDFPGFEIYARLWRANQLETDVPTVAEISSRLRNANGAPPPAPFFKKEYQIGLWVQRVSLQQWFPNFDPTRYGSSKEYPYDLDHILPSAYKNMRGRTRWGAPAQEFWQWRWRVINGSGNVRYWPASLNRSDQHKNLGQKMLLGPSEQPTPLDSLLHAYSLDTVGQVRAASLIEDDQLDNWERGANHPHPYDWRDPERIKALRRATDARRLNLYKRFYEGVGFRKWQDQFSPWLAATIREEVTRIWIEESRDAGPGEVAIHARFVAEEIRLPDRISAICAALDASEFYVNGLSLKKRTGPEVGEDAVWIVEWSGDV